MLVQFPGSPDRFRTLLASASLDGRRWSGFERLLRQTFRGVQTSIVCVPRSQPARIPFRIAVGFSVSQSASPSFAQKYSEVPGALLVPGSEALGALDDEGGEVFGVVLTANGSLMEVFTAKLPAERAQMYRNAIEILLARISKDLVDAYTASRYLGTSHRPERARIEAQWDNLPTAVALIEPDLSIAAANMAMAEILDDGRMFRRARASNRLVPTIAEIHDRLHEAVTDIAAGTKAKARINVRPLSGTRFVRLDLKAPAMPHSSGWTQRPAVLVTATQGAGR